MLDWIVDAECPNLQRRPFKDTSSSAALTRFNKALDATYEAQLSSLTEEEYKQLEEQEEVKEVLDILDSLGDDEDEEEEKPKRGSRKRSVSVSEP